MPSSEISEEDEAMMDTLNPLIEHMFGQGAAARPKLGEVGGAAQELRDVPRDQRGNSGRVHPDGIDALSVVVVERDVAEELVG